MSKGRILVVEDKPEWRNDLTDVLSAEGYDVQNAANYELAKQKLDSYTFDVVTVDLNLKEGTEDENQRMMRHGELILRHINQNYPSTRCIVVSGQISTKREMRDLLRRKGAFDCITKDDFDWDEFLDMVEEAINAPDEAKSSSSPSAPARSKSDPIRIFVSYKHDDYDNQILDEIISYMERDVQAAGGVFWTDREIRVGDMWDEAIRKELAQSDIALVLVSQAYLGSEYINNVELTSFIRDRKENGLLIFPIILSSCLWQRHDWLAQTQFMPTDGTLDYEYADLGKRKRLYLDITSQLLDRIEDIRAARSD